MSNFIFDIPTMISPITNKNNTVLEKGIKTSMIINSYKNTFNIDVSHFFEGIPEVRIFKCLDTAYRFYYPFNIDGDGKFYEHFQQYDWYYMPWKWEHQQTAKFLKPKMKVLEVGCAKGDFLAKIQKDYGVEVVGLELNQTAAEEARNKGLNVLNEMVQEHTEANKEKYDIVCSFEVLEHIAEVKSFLEANVNCLKKGGKLIIAVPNNDSFIKYTADSNILNMPPHHMGLWSSKSLKNLEKILPVRLDTFMYEPIQEYHKAWYNNTMHMEFKQFRGRKRYQLIYQNLPTFLKWRMDYYTEMLMKQFHQKGHTILASYTKKIR